MEIKYFPHKEGVESLKVLGISWWESRKGRIFKEALKREIKEELQVDIRVNDLIKTIEYDYPTFHLTMHCFWCELEGEFKLTEHLSSKWLDKETLYSVNWLEARYRYFKGYRKSIINR